ncbi:hypothetical protein PoB_006564600 [Plakobranchus ocellatus]|uniref:Apple domain-containing protein n=1 Tax=Plakobranchus ocellatus TaxID=259542 RepID=A0AAV4D4X8_9GAST|nr:hypothetical protein PoB_006564600 [Plakobranchus ocellatus]
MALRVHGYTYVLISAALTFVWCEDCSCRATHDFHLTSGIQNFTEGERVCKSLGYDGLAVAKSPEAYHDMLDILAGILKNPEDGVYLAIRGHLDIGQLVWDDGSTMAEDTPSSYSLRHGGGLMGRLTTNRKVRLGDGVWNRAAVCGNYHTKAFSYGRAAHGKQPAGVSSNLNRVSVVSFLDCALQCGQDYKCRAAKFNSLSLTCVTFGSGSYTALADNPHVSTFIRKWGGNVLYGCTSGYSSEDSAKKVSIFKFPDDPEECRQLLISKIRKRQATFFGHVMRRDKLENLVTTGMLEGKRSRGKQREKLIEGLTDWLKAGKSLEAIEATKDRKKWRTMIANAVKQGT